MSSESVTARISALSRRAQDDLLRWLEQGRRDETDEERIFYEARQLPPSELERVISALRERIGRGRQS